MWLEVVHGGNILNNYTPAYKYSKWNADAEALFAIKAEISSSSEASILLRRMRREYYLRRLGNYRLVLSNYLFGTSATAVNAIISLLIYPYVIRMLGIEQYGVLLLLQTQ